MATFKATFIFNFGKVGWSEVWYRESSNPDEMLEIAKKLGGVRVRALATDVQLEYIRISDVAVAGDSLVAGIGQWGTETTGDPDTPWNSVYMRYESSSLYRRQFHWRGLPDDWVKPTGTNLNQDPWDARFRTVYQAYTSSLKNNSWMMKVISKDPGDITPKNITGISADGQGRITFAVAGLTGDVNDTFRVKFYNGPDKKLLNKVYTIVSNNGAAVVVPDKFADLSDPNANTGGKAIARITKYKIVTDGIPLRYAAKRTGRAFFVPAGRRSVKK